MKLFDFHCDTPFALEKTGELLTENVCHIDLKKAETFEEYGQVMAVWTQRSLSEELAWHRFFEIKNDFDSKMTEKTLWVTRYDAFSRALSEKKYPFFLAVEGAGLLNGKLERLHTLYENGVRFLTLVWKGSDGIGGAFDSKDGLTDFGREVVEGCFELGIVPDLSHASDKMSEEVLKMAHDAKKPVIATHSNSRAVYAHPRNLPDEYAKEIASLGGTVGISMAPMHLDKENEAGIPSICSHMAHYLDIGMQDSLTFGCDFDGIDLPPAGIKSVRDLPKIADGLREMGISEQQIEKIFFDNAEAFLKRNF